MSSLDYFTAGFNKAVARRSKEQAKQHEQQKVQKVTGDVSNTVTTITKTSNGVAITQLDHDELYRTTIVTKMLNLIHKQKENNHD